MKRHVSIAVAGITLLAAVYVLRVWRQVEWRQATREDPSRQAEFEKRTEDFEFASEYLAVSLRPEEYFDTQEPGPFVVRHDIPRILSVLVFDLPDTITSVERSYLENWGKTEDELFAIALENVRAGTSPELNEVELPYCGTVKALLGESYVTATHALLMEEHPECLGPFGALMGVPNRHTVLCYPVADKRVTLASVHMAEMISRFEQEGPGSISRRLFWYDKGKYTELPYTLEGSELTFEMPEEFIRMLERIAEAEGTRPGTPGTEGPGEGIDSQHPGEGTE